MDEYRHGTLALAKKNPRESIWQTTKTISIKSSYSLSNPVLFQEPGGRIHLWWVAFISSKEVQGAGEGEYSVKAVGSGLESG
ncbi:MAG: hypothetical protein HN646_08535 [Nitrospina sp.]|nr:hypothetical protein [Nitrospina sp.]MBT6717247.1 hypothetical protein [Nitrospina sp.]MBT7522306.1 hypothetical protein [Nitrospina sp.]